MMGSRSADELLQIFVRFITFFTLLTIIEIDSSCVIENKKYNFSLLNWSSWNVTVQEETVTVYYHLDVCHPLSTSTCTNGASVCRKQGNSVQVIGYQTSAELIESQNPEDGFWLRYVGDACSQEKFRTLINFHCGPSLGSPEFLYQDECEIFFSWKSSVACSSKPLQKEVPCYVYDKNDKKRDLSPLVLTSGAYHVKSGITAIDFNINVCGNIVPNLKTDRCPQSSAACRKIGNEMISFGIPSSPLQIDNDENLMLKYTAESSQFIPPGCTLQPQTIITFVCPHKHKSDSIYSQFMGPVLTGTGNCQYEVEWVTEYACPMEQLISSNCQMNEEQHGVIIDLRPLAKKLNDPPYQVNVTGIGKDKLYFYLNPCGSLPVTMKCHNSLLSSNAVCMKSKSDPVGLILGSIIKEELRFTDGELTLTYKDGDVCSIEPTMKITTVINFKCDPTVPIGQPEFNKNFSCTYFFSWKTKLACTGMATGFQCEAKNGTQIVDLSSLIKHHGSAGKWDVFTDTVPDYQDSQIVINICGPLNSNGGMFDQCPKGSAACINEPNRKMQSLGSFASSPRFIDGNKIELRYINGSICPESPSKMLSTVIILTCKPGETDSGPILNRVSTDECLFEIEWKTAAACVQSLHVGTDCHVFNKEIDFDFDLSPLRKASYYLTSNDEYDFYINVCGESLNTPCSSLGKHAVCQVKKKNRSMFWNLGVPNDKLQYYNGFINLTYTDGTPYNKIPHSPRETMISFICDPEAGHGHPEFVEESERIYNFRWYTALACPEKPFECSAFNENTLEEFDLSSLTKTLGENNWEVSVTDKDEKKTMYINVCRQLSKEIPGCDSGMAACLKSGKNVVNAGRMIHRPKFISNILTLEYDMGDPCDRFGENSTFKTYIHFLCPKDKNETESLKFSHVIAKCDYVFIWQTTSACALKETQTSNKCMLSDPISGITYNLQPMLNIYTVSSSTDENFQTFIIGLCGTTVHCEETSEENVAVCGIDKTGKSSVLGLVDTVHLRLSHRDRIVVTYQGNQNLSTGKPVTIVEILLQCSHETHEQMKFIKNDNNHYIFQMETSVACPPPSQECSVIRKGRVYDLSSLSLHNSYWEVEDTRPDHRDLRYYINVCSPVINPNSPGCLGNNIGACQVVLSTNTSYSLGIIHNRPHLSENGELSLHYEGGSSCHNQYRRSIRILFHCSLIQKSPIFVDETPECEYIVSWDTPAACPIQQLTGNHCQVDDPLFGFYFDMTPLRVQSPFSIQTGEHTYTIGICSQVYCGNENEVGVCQVKDGNFISAGKFNEHLEYNDGELSLTYIDGQSQCHGKFNRSSKIIFTCDPHTTGKPVFVNESADCSYLFLWETSLACSPSTIIECTARNSEGNLYDLSSLTLAKDSHEYNSPDKKLKFLINVCHSIPLSSGSLCDYSSGVCLFNTTDQRFINLGNVLKKPYFENDILKLKYELGDFCNSSVKYQSIISFLCDESKLESEPVFLRQDGCTWHFLWETASACALEKDEIISDDCTAINPSTGFQFNLTSLRKSSGYIFSDDSEHHYTINVCGGISGSPCDSRAGSCQWKQNGTKKWNAGVGNNKLHFHNGVLSLNYSNGSPCKKGKLKRNTIINFVCSQSAGIGKPVFVDMLDNCTYFIMWHTSLACEKHIHCKVASGLHTIDLTPLMKYNEPYMAPSDNLNDIYLINVCRPLNPSPHVLCPPEAAVCKFKFSTDESLSLGQVKTLPYIDANGNVVLEYFDGSWCPQNSIIRLHSRITFLCKEGDDLGYPELVQVINDCQYVFTWMTNVVCEKPSVILSRLGPNSYTFINSTSQTVFDLSLLRDGAVSSSKTNRKDNLIFSLNDDMTTSECEQGTALCRNSTSLGSVSSVEAVYEESVLKLYFSGGQRCSADTTQWSSEIWFTCDFAEETGSPALVEEFSCHSYFHWKTSIVCTTKAAECTVFDKNNNLLDLRILASHSHGWNFTDSSNNTYWINLCHSLPELPAMREKCPESTICMQTSTGMFYSLGKLESQQFHFDADEVLILSYNSTSDLELCSSGQIISASIYLKCGEGRGHPTFLGLDRCHYKFEWLTFAACPNNKNREQLKLSGEIIQDEAQNIKINISPWMKRIFTINEERDINTKYNYEIIMDSQSGTLSSCKISGICQKEVGNDFHRIIGTLNNPEIYQTTNGMEMVLSSNSQCGRNSKKNASTIITFQCSSNEDDIRFIYESLDCVYIFSWQTKLLCPQNFQPAYPSYHVHRNHISPQRLSTGTTFVVVGFIIGFLLLFIIVVNRQNCRDSTSYRLGVLWRKTRHGPAYRYSAIPQNPDGSTERTFLLRQEGVHPTQAFQEDDDEVLQI